MTQPQTAAAPTVPSRILCLLPLLLAGAGLAQEAQDTPPPPRQGGADPSEDAFRFGSPPSLADGLTEEDMWPAATAEQWQQPCLVHWQRSFSDAMQVARAQRRPLMVAVNMDGEIASEHFAGVRYRDPEMAALISRYVCVVASVYRHTPRDYDEAGNRIECPRFGTVTCGEHIEAERELYGKYFDGRRISPRHIVLDLDGKKTSDVYYSWDTASVVTSYVKNVEGWPEPIEPGERTLQELVKSADVADREVVERIYSQGDRRKKREVLEALLDQEAAEQVEVLRSAIFGFDLELAALSRRALAQCESEPALDLMAEALKVPLEASEREVLLDAVEHIAETSPRARTLAALHSGLSGDSAHIDARSVRDLAAEYEASAASTLDVDARAKAAAARPNEPGALLELAEALVGRAETLGDQRFRGYLIEDARAAARDAEQLGAEGPRLDALVAVVTAELGDRQAARERAVKAVEGGLLDLEGGAPSAARTHLSEPSLARVLLLFAEARRNDIRRAYRSGEEWKPEWLSDVNAAYSILADGLLSDERPLAEHHDFLRWIGATPRAKEVLADALRRFPDSPLLHERLRSQLLWDGGPEELERGYADRLSSLENSGGQLRWFAGYASLVAAEHYRRRGQFDAAGPAYDRAVGSYERHVELFPEAADDCSHYVSLAHAGRARLALEQGELESATDLLVLALATRPDSAASADGLGITPVATARMLKARLLAAGDTERAARVQESLDALDPKLLEPPPSELPNPRRRGGRRR